MMGKGKDLILSYRFYIIVIGMSKSYEYLFENGFFDFLLWIQGYDIYEVQFFFKELMIVSSCQSRVCVIFFNGVSIRELCGKKKKIFEEEEGDRLG